MLKITACPSRSRRSKTRRSESPELNPSSREKEGEGAEGRGEERADDGTGPSRRRKRRRKIPEINFEMEKGGRQRNQQQQLPKEVSRLLDEEAGFSITETLPEHFKKALLKSLFPKEEEDTADARKRRKIATIFGSRCPSLANEEREGETAAIGTARARSSISSRVNPLKLIRRFVPGTNQEEYKVEGRLRGRRTAAAAEGTAAGAIKEEIVVDLASDDDDHCGDNKSNQISREKSISEAYLRAARMPLINVSLVTKGRKEDEEGAIVRLERLSEREIDRHLKRGTTGRRGENVEDDVEVLEEQVVFGHEKERILKDFKDLVHRREDPGTARERRGHQQQLRRRHSFASYRNASMVAAGRQSSPLHLSPPKQGCFPIELLLHLIKALL